MLSAAVEVSVWRVPAAWMVFRFVILIAGRFAASLLV